MVCNVCNTTTNSKETEDCFENALDAIKLHYIYYRNAVEQRDLELKQVKERNEKLNKALELLQKYQQPNKRFKTSQPNSETWLSNIPNNDDRITSDTSLTDDEPITATNLNVAINSEQLFETSTLSPGKNDSSITSSEFIISPRHKESPKRNRQREIMHCLKDSNKKSLKKCTTEWHTKERNSPVEKSWATKFLKPSTSKPMKSKSAAEFKKTDKRICLSLKKQNPSKMKQSLIQFNKSKDGCLNESDVCEDIIESSPMVINKNSKSGRSWAHRSDNNISSNNSCSSNNNSRNALTTNINHKQDDIHKTLDDIVFDFSPTKKTEDSMANEKSLIKSQPKELKFDDISIDCTSLPNDNLGFNSPNKTNSSSVVILTPNTEDIIFVDDTCNDDMDTMALLADIMKPNNTENLKKYESKTIQKQQKDNKMQQFKKPQMNLESHNFIKPTTSIKQEKIAQNLENSTKLKEHKVTCSSTTSTSKQQNPLFSSDDQEYDEEEEDDSMPKPFVVKQEPEVSKTSKKLSFKERYNIDCDYCENYIKILGDNLTDDEIQKHINKCTRHNNGDAMRQNTPKDFWNPFILSFQEDDPRNEVLIDTRFKNKTSLEK